MIFETFGSSEWNHCVITRGSDGTNAYVNTNPDSSFLWNNKFGDNPLNVDGFVVAEEQDSVLGGYASGQAHQGLVDEIRVYNRALSEEEINALYQMREQRSYNV